MSNIITLRLLPHFRNNLRYAHAANWHEAPDSLKELAFAS